ncbi:MAG TPA: hypothetical protein PKZ52_06100 [Cellvibrionaceae bacterium]|nr:hypothetical protein [Cellvibrionaceae bacterium]
MGRRRQTGATLISLLVGMVVSMLAILASLSMFHDLVTTSAEAKTDARQEGDLSLAVLRLDTELQAAGFNMGRSPGEGRNLDFVTAASADGSRHDVAWRFNDGAQMICRRATSSTSNGIYSLDLFSAPAASCTAAWPLAGNVSVDASWTFAERLVYLPLQNLTSQAAAFTQPLITFTSLAANDRACMPYGAIATGVTDVHPILTLGVFDVSTVYSGAANAVPSRPHSLCLANIF